MKILTFQRQWAMPSADTFSIAPIKSLLARWLKGRTCIVDPFARDSTLAHWRNDLNPKTKAESHMDARDFLMMLYDQNIEADAFLFDPPYSPRQISEVYQQVGRSCSMEDTQNAKLYREVRDLADKILAPGAVVVSAGWNSAGMGGNSYRIEELLLVPHGGAHNDTIVLVETKTQGSLFSDSLAEDSLS